MFFKVSNFKISKKNIILIVFVLLFAIGGVFYYQNRDIKGSPDDYVIIETEEGTIVENKRAGLLMKVPDGWNVRKIEVMEGSVVFYSSDAQGLNPEKIRPPLQKGCMIEVAMAYRKTNFEEIEKEVEELHKALIMKYDKFEEIKINGKSALKNTFDCTELGPSVDIYILVNYLYGAGVSMASQDIERCSEEFDEFLKEVSIVN